MKAGNIPDFAIARTNCDWIIQQSTEVKSLIGYNSKAMIHLNKSRALSAICTMEDSLRELKAFIEECNEQ